MTRHLIGPGDGAFVDLAGVGVRFLLDAQRTGGGFSLVEHPIAPRTLGSPVHTHTREDEWSFVLEGRVGLMIGDDELEAGPGDLVLKPRGVPHAFWNATDERARLLEIIAPAGFERYFDEIAKLFPKNGEPDLERFAEISDRYGLIMQPETIPVLMERHGLIHV